MSRKGNQSTKSSSSSSYESGNSETESVIAQKEDSSEPVEQNTAYKTECDRTLLESYLIDSINAQVENSSKDKKSGNTAKGLKSVSENESKKAKREIPSSEEQATVKKNEKDYKTSSSSSNGSSTASEDTAVGFYES